MNISELKVEEPFKSLFKMDDRVLSAIQDNMRFGRYDQSKPITIWRGRNIVIDGHTRLLAAESNFMKTIPVKELDFKDEDAALVYALHHQRNRRNLDDAHILHLVEKLDKMYKMGGDRRSIFATTKLDLFDEDIPRESSREVTAKLIGTTAEKVSQCRHVLQNCSNDEIKSIRDRKRSLHNVYKSSLAAERNEAKKLKEKEIRLKKLQELKTSKFPTDMSKIGLRQYGKILEKLDTLVLELFPNLDKRSSDMQEIRNIVEFFQSNNENFKVFCEQPPVQRFLGSLLVDDFIAVLKCFGYKILTPCTLKVIKEERVVKVKQKRPVPLPHCNISRVHEIGFISKAQRREMDRRWERAVERDMEEGRI